MTVKPTTSSAAKTELYAEGKPCPTFTIKATDALAFPVIRTYADICRQFGLHHQAKEVEKALEEFRQWQIANVDQTKLPDHDHVPAWEPKVGAEWPE